MDIPGDFFVGLMELAGSLPTSVELVDLVEVAKYADEVLAVGSGQQPAGGAPYPSLVLSRLSRSGVVWSRAHALCPELVDCHAWRIRPAQVARLVRDGFAVVGTAEIPASESHLFVARLSEHGDIVWIRVYDGERGNPLAAVGIADVTAASGDPLRLLVLAQTTVGMARAVTFVLDEKGGVVGEPFAYVGLNATRPAALRWTETQGLFILGAADPLGIGRTQGWLLQIAPNGMPVWETFYDSQLFSRLTDIAEGTDSLIALAGDAGALVIVQKAGGPALPGLVLSSAASRSGLRLGSIVSHEFLIVSATAPGRGDLSSDGIEWRSSLFILASRSDSSPAWLAQIDEGGRILWQKNYPIHQSMFERAIWPRVDDIVAVGRVYGRQASSSGLVAWSGGMAHSGREYCGREAMESFVSIPVTAAAGPRRFAATVVDGRDWRSQERPVPLFEVICPAAASIARDPNLT